MERIPVYLISGFLGAGKTTYLNHFIRSRAPKRIFVIENEVGKVNVDSSLVFSGVEEVLELTAGCLCCSLNDELLDVLEEVSARRSEFDELVIETTGIADPGSIAKVFLGIPGVERIFELRHIVAVVDAGQVLHWLEETDEARRQIAIADFLLLNKTDLVDETELPTIRKALKGINPYAELYEGTQGQFPIGEYIDKRPLAASGMERLQEELEGHSHHHHDISTFTLEFERPFVLEGLGYELVRLLQLYSHQVYRVKGIIAVQNLATKVILQSVRDNLILTDGSAWELDDHRISRVVVIGKDLQQAPIEKLFKRHLAANS
ncbi:MAG: GTP-binding protein [Phaeodactylibacter sp.]|nr:GTP-binding protein [Phaeodactylibacter sp.]